jgi:hypothetical protein
MLLTSGYPKERLPREGKLDEEFDLLSKPYNLKELGEWIETVLEG